MDELVGWCIDYTLFFSKFAVEYIWCKSFFLKSPMHDFTQNEEPVNHLFQQYTLLKNAIREMGGYEPDEEMDWISAANALPQPTLYSLKTGG